MDKIEITEEEFLEIVKTAFNMGWDSSNVCANRSDYEESLYNCIEWLKQNYLAD